MSGDAVNIDFQVSSGDGGHQEGRKIMNSNTINIHYDTYILAILLAGIYVVSREYLLRNILTMLIASVSKQCCSFQVQHSQH